MRAFVCGFAPSDASWCVIASLSRSLALSLSRSLALSFSEKHVHMQVEPTTTKITADARAHTHIQTKMLLVLGRLAELAVMQQKRDERCIPRALGLVTAQFVVPLVEEEEEDAFQDITLGAPGVGRSWANSGEKDHATPSIRERERHKHVVALSEFASCMMEGVLGRGEVPGVEPDGRHVATLALISVLFCFLFSCVPLSSHPLLFLPFPLPFPTRPRICVHTRTHASCMHLCVLLVCSSAYKYMCAY